MELAMTKLTAFLAAAIVSVAAPSALAEEINVKMLNKGSSGEIMVFEPNLIHAKVGDLVTFIPADPGHNAESISGMLPEGAEGFKGKVNEKISYEVREEGVYGVKCLPHYGMGMVALIVAGDPDNIESARAVRQMAGAKKKFDKLFTEAAVIKE